MSNKKKYYAVRKGTKCGIFSTWKDCQEAVQNYSGAEYKSFLSEEEARAYLSDRDIYEEEVKELLREGWGVAVVDGSFDTEVGKYGSGVVAFRPDGHKEELFRAGQNPKFIGTKNVAGELFAVLLALDWAVCSEISKLKIYHDYEGVHKWLSSEWKPQSPVSKMYVEIYKHKYEGLLLVDFVKVNGHSNNKYNDLADRLAKESLSKRGRVVKGSSFAAFSYVKKDVWKDLVEKLKETFEGTWESHSETCYQSSDFFRAASGDKVTLTFYSVSRKATLQGAVTPFFQEVLSEILSSLGIEEKALDRVYSDVYRVNVDSQDISTRFKAQFNFPADYPSAIKNLVRTALISLAVNYECPEYSHFVFPALKAVEGHLKYLFFKNGMDVTEKGFGEFFEGKSDKGAFILKNPKLAYAKEICEAYSFWNAQRHTIFHYGQLFGKIDSTRELKTKADANEIIQRSLMIVNNIK